MESGPGRATQPGAVASRHGGGGADRGPAGRPAAGDRAGRGAHPPPAPSAILERLGRSLDLLSGGGARVASSPADPAGDARRGQRPVPPTSRSSSRRLAVLADEWSPDDAQAIADPAHVLENFIVLDGLASLVDKSLLRVIDAPGRRGALRPARLRARVRPGAAGRLGRAGGAGAAPRRAFLHAGRGAGPASRGGGGRAVHTPHGRRHPRCGEGDDLALDVRVNPTSGCGSSAPAGGGGKNWMKLREGLDWPPGCWPPTDAPIRRPSCRPGRAGQPGVLVQDFVLTRRAYEERLAIAETLGDPHGLAEAHYDIAFVGMVEQDLDFLRRESELALAMFERLGDQAGIIRARQAAVLAHYLAGDHETARRMEEQNLADFRDTRRGTGRRTARRRWATYGRGGSVLLPPWPVRARGSGCLASVSAARRSARDHRGRAG